MSTSTITRAHETADELFERHATVFGKELPIYRGHVHRVIGVVGLQCDVPADVAVPLGVAGFFHDAGIWFDGTWDYLPPSVRRAVSELSDADAPHAELVSSLISEHHRMRKARHSNPLVEAFRRADLTDVSAGLIGAPGATRTQYKQLVERYPAGGFRPMLLRAFGRGLKESPTKPMPMMKF